MDPVTQSGHVGRPPIMDWGVSWRALPGESESGDRHVVAAFPAGILVGVVDGLGHGPEAAAAARLAVEILEKCAGEPVVPLVERCHEALRKTRGAVLSIASLNILEEKMSWVAVGNVEAMLFRADRTARPPRETLVLRSGVVGYQLPRLKSAEHSLRAGDVLVFASDGVEDNFGGEMPLDLAPKEAAAEILDRFGKDSDDALVLVARWRGTQP